MLYIYIAYNRTGTHVLVGPIEQQGMEYVFKLFSSLPRWSTSKGSKVYNI